MYKSKNSSIAKSFLTILSLGQIIFACGLLVYQQNSYLWIVRLIGSYQLLVALLNFFSYYLMLKDGAIERYQRLAFALVNFIFAIDGILTTNQGYPALLRLGIYLTFIGISYLNDGGFTLFDSRKEQIWRRSLRLPLPVIFSALFPQKLISSIDEIIVGNVQDVDTDYRDSLYTFNQSFPEQGENLITIQIPVGKSTFDKVGHMNIAYKNTVYFYGNHDDDTRNLWDSSGEGVLALIDRSEYLTFSLKNHLTIAEYDIAITSQQAQKLEEKLTQIKEQTVNWVPQSKAVLNSFVGKLMRQTEHTKFYKFKEGQFQTYFVFWTNCVLFSDNMLEAMGLNLSPLVGIQTPGTYYDFLEREYQQEKSIVLERRIYNQDLGKYLTKIEREESKNIN
ncbi:hypothetical protein [Facklamia sp. 7083-14-GEN3]|uniref:hypothetical protein n=1 Tax=Facklamia sp. 7083-14-GEN3 TaxID=2973478 RepID=UPI00215BD327|nr:hypothetical protein [Facklamia sp. 7083-14-GEN3]MCR8968388.1 hypothetical protein [Facklamia sp. 7083-14-GEN3]